MIQPLSRRALCPALVLLTLVTTALASAEEGAEDPALLRSKVVDAVGGTEALRSVESLRSTGQFATNSRFVEQRVLRQRPDRYRVERGSWKPGREQDMVLEGFDGETAWAVDPTADPPGRQSLDDSRRQSLQVEAQFFWSLLELPEDARLSSPGKVETELGELFELRIERDDAPLEVWLVDPDTFLPAALYTERWDWDRLREIRYYFHDWREVEGVLFPFTIEDEFSSFHRMQRIETLEVNVELDPSAFAPPPR